MQFKPRYKLPSCKSMCVGSMHQQRVCRTACLTYDAGGYASDMVTIVCELLLQAQKLLMKLISCVPEGASQQSEIVLLACAMVSVLLEC